MEFRIRETKIGYYIDLFFMGNRVIEGANLYYEDIAEELVKRLNNIVNK